MSEIIQPNTILPTGYEQARDILMDLHAVLKRYKAELFFRKEQRAMLLWVSDGSKEVYGGYKVVGLIHKILPLAGPSYDRAVYASDQIMSQNTVRPSNYAQVEDILKSMHEVLAKHDAALIFDVGREGMHLLVGSGGIELAIVRNITRFGAELNKANFDTATLRIPAQFDEADTAAVQAWLKTGKIQ